MKVDASWLLLIVAGFLFFGQGKGCTPPTPNPTPSPSPVDPSNPLASFRGKLGASAVGKAHRDFALVVSRPATTYSSSGKLKADLIRFHDVLYAGTPTAGTLQGFSGAFDQAFVKAFGEQDAAIDDARAIAFLESAAAALGG